MSPPLFAKPPHPISSGAALSQFNVAIPEEDVQNLKTLLKILPIAAANYENSQNDRRFGSPRQWLVESVAYWQNKFDWRKMEEKINTIPSFKANVQDDDGHTYSVHFAALFSANKDAVPILLSHGWPGSFIEFLPILLSQREKYASAPEKLPYHLIVPSLIGYGFSSPPPLDKDFIIADNSRIFNKLMLSLGFGEAGYIAQGGDVGCAISEVLLASYEPVKAAHLNMYWARSATKSSEIEDPLESKAVERGEKLQASGMAYAILHATRPSTSGLSVGSSPTSLLAWIGEKMIDWSDPATTPSLDEILTNVSIYWFTGTYPTSLWPYRALFSDNPGAGTGITHGKPKGVSWFPNEIAPVSKDTVRADSKVTNFYEHDKGGHFAALEVPDVLWADIEDFVAKAWKK
ncbi:Alpha/beta hydrolase fold-1 [Botryosphaeria dothidea]|uniref:Alpha/beta hydrolase fold-1 n=1 Tax=Botryosphaeria dothidea TaxID=55169 RepID=A0A8H4N8Q0_9PEZI|nr:Alpha/beta hydrolase fold-1 [Botryosphaeria dothidea]